MTSQVSFSLENFFKWGQSAQIKSDLTDLTTHLKKRKNENWHLEKSDLQFFENPQGIIEPKNIHNSLEVIKAFNQTGKKDDAYATTGEENEWINIASAAEKANLAIGYMIQKFEQLDESAREEFSINFNYYANKNMMPSHQTFFKLMNITSEMIFLSYNKEKNLVNKLNKTLSELNNMCFKLKENPALLTWYCIKRQLELKQQALIKHLYNLNAEDATSHIPIHKLNGIEPAKMTKEQLSNLKKRLSQSIIELEEQQHSNSQQDTQVRPKLLKKSYSVRVQEFVNNFVTDKNLDAISLTQLQSIYPSLSISPNTNEEIIKLNNLYREKISTEGKSPVIALCDILDSVREKTNPKKVRTHMRQVPSGATWLDASDLAKFAEEREVKKTYQELLKQQRENGNYRAFVFKPNPKLSPNNNTNAKK